MSNQEQQERQLQLFKNQLFQSLKQTGIVDNLKAQLKNQVAKHLSSQVGSKEIQSEKSVEIIPMRRKILTLIILDYLRVENLNLTYEIFIPETHTFPEEIMTSDELRKTLNANPKTHATVLEEIYHIFERKNCATKCERFCQTEEIGENQKSAAHKLQDLEEEYEKKMTYFNLGSAKTQEESMIKYKKELEKKYQQDLAYELERVRSFEIQEVKLLEQERLQRELTKHRKETDDLYQHKLKELKEREKNLLELSKRKIEEIEKMAHEHRQRQILELSDLEKRQEVFKRHKCEENEEILNILDKNKALEAQLTLKIREYEDAREKLSKMNEENGKNRVDKLKREKSLLGVKQNQFDKINQEQQDYIQQHKEYAQSLVRQKEQLSIQIENQQCDIRQLDEIRNQQYLEITNQKDQIQSLQERVSISETRLESYEKQTRLLKTEKKALEELNGQLNEQILTKTNQLTLIQKQFNQNLEVERQKVFKNQQTVALRMEEQSSQYQTSIKKIISQKDALESYVSELQAQIKELQMQIRYREKSDFLTKENINLSNKKNEKPKEEELEDLKSQMGMLKNQIKRDLFS